MSSMSAIIRLLVSLVFLAVVIDKTEGIPFASFPINAQVPPVAHGGIIFDFTFSSITFSNASSNLTYSMNGASSWLNLDSTTRRFSGKPSKGDEEVMNFNLVATDSTGSTVMPVTFVVTDSLGPQLAPSAGTSMLIGGHFNGPKSFVLSPGATIDITLNSSIFVDTNTTTQYYVVCSDNSPLPSWLNFNPSELSFSGAVPEASSPSELPQVYDLRVIATDTPGFSSAVFPVRLTIDQHLLTFNNERFYISVADGQAFNFTDLKNNLTLDGEVIDPSLISSVYAQAPFWIFVDPTNLTISGTPPQDFISQSFWVSVNDTYGDSANTTVFLFTSGLSESNITQILGAQIPTIIACPGQNLSYTIPATAFTSSNISTSVDLGNCSSWLQYNSSDLTFTGTAPTTLEGKHCSANFTVIEGSQSDWEVVKIFILNPSNATNTTTSAPTQASVTSAATSSSSSQPGLSFGQVAIMSVLITVFVVVVPLVILAILRARSNKKKGENARKEEAAREAESRGDSIVLEPVPKPVPEPDPRNHLDLIAPFRNTSPLDESSFAPHPNWHGLSRTAGAESENSSVTMDDGPTTQRRDSSLPLSTAAGNHTERRRGVALPSACNGDLGHGRGAPPRQIPVIMGHATYPKPGQKAKHRPLTAGFDPSVFAPHAHPAMKPVSVETVQEQPVPAQTSTQASVQAASPPGRVKRAFQSLGAARSNFSIRPVAKSPTPSEMPSPDLAASPRAKLQSWIRDRATERQSSGLFGSSATQHDTERGLTAPSSSSSSAATSYIASSDGLGNSENGLRRSSGMSNITRHFVRQQRGDNDTDNEQAGRRGSSFFNFI